MQSGWNFLNNSLCHQIQEGKHKYSGGCSLKETCALFKTWCQILGFDNIRELYQEDQDFAFIFAKCERRAQEGYYVSEGYLFKEGKLCIPQVHIENFL